MSNLKLKEIVGMAIRIMHEIRNCEMQDILNL